MNIVGDFSRESSLLQSCFTHLAAKLSHFRWRFAVCESSRLAECKPRSKNVMDNELGIFFSFFLQNKWQILEKLKKWFWISGRVLIFHDFFLLCLQQFVGTHTPVWNSSGSTSASYLFDPASTSVSSLQQRKPNVTIFRRK